MGYYVNGSSYPGIENYNYDYGDDKKPKALAFLAALFAVVIVALIVTVLFTKFYKQEDGRREELPVVESEQLVFTSPTDAEQQVEVRGFVDYDWAVLVNTPLDDRMAMKAVPYLATLELETAVQQHALLNSSERYVGSEALQLLKDDSSLKGVLENLAVIEHEYYSLGLPSGVVHAERLRHLAKRLDVYGPPSGEIRDSETRQFVQNHLGFSVDSYEAWYALIRLKYGRLVQNMESTKDKKSVLTIDEYLKEDERSDRKEPLLRE